METNKPLKREYLKEGWLHFERYHFQKGGYIDRCMLDQANDPNADKPNLWQFNSVTLWIRCNNTKWYRRDELNGWKIFDLLLFANEYSAQEIWDELVCNKTYNLKTQKP